MGSPGEFPWTCLVLNQNNDFIGSCAVIPNDSSNNNGRGTRKVVTAAHKLKNIQHEEYTVVRLLKHPQFNAGRLSNDIALLYTDRDVPEDGLLLALSPGGWDVPAMSLESMPGC